jgi:drug/metabolite transporter (DMT)-like permease
MRIKRKWDLTMKEKQKGYIYLIMTFVIWGSLYVVSKFVLGKLPTFTVSCSRFVLAFIALTILDRGKHKKLEKADYKYVLLIGVAGYFIAVGAQLLGTKYAGASLASLINALNPITMTFFAAWLLHEKITVKKVLGLILAILGVYAILGGNSQEVSGIGVGLSLFAVLLWSLVSVFTRKVTQKYDSIQITRYAIGVAAVCYLPICLGEVVGNSDIHFEMSWVVALLYMSVICTGVAYLLWNKSLSILEAGTCSAFYPIQPLVSAGLGIVFLHEQLGIAFVIGAVMITAGVLINLKG